MSHYDDIRELSDAYEHRKDVISIVKVGSFYKDGIGRNILITKVLGIEHTFPIKAIVYETGGEVSYTSKGTYFGGMVDHKDLIIEEQDLDNKGSLTSGECREKARNNEEVNNMDNIIEAHGSKWEITHSVSSEDMVNNPKHYAFFESDTGDTEAIEIIASSMSHEEFKGYCKGNALKYRLRVGKKDNIVQELAKADKYQELYHLHKQRTLDWGLINK